MIAIVIEQLRNFLNIHRVIEGRGITNLAFVSWHLQIINSEKQVWVDCYTAFLKSNICCGLFCTSWCKTKWLNLENFVKFIFPEIFHNKEMLNRFYLMWDGQFQHQPQGKKLVPTLMYWPLEYSFVLNNYLKNGNNTCQHDMTDEGDRTTTNSSMQVTLLLSTKLTASQRDRNKLSATVTFPWRHSIKWPIVIRLGMAWGLIITSGVIPSHVNGMSCTKRLTVSIIYIISTTDHIESATYMAT